MEAKSAVCEFCNPRCRILVYSEDGKLAKMEEDRSHPRAVALAIARSQPRAIMSECSISRYRPRRNSGRS
jgi:anaerobic selenocysteine-containing dehydrogenase